VQKPSKEADASTVKSPSGDANQQQIPVDKAVAEVQKQDDAGPRSEPSKTTSRGFQKSKGGSTLFSENSGF